MPNVTGFTLVLTVGGIWFGDVFCPTVLVWLN
jgi:hypothetical protein